MIASRIILSQDAENGFAGNGWGRHVASQVPHSIIRLVHGSYLKEFSEHPQFRREIVMILQTWFEEVWNKGNEAAIDRLLAPDVAIHNLLGGNGEEVYDIPTFKAMFRAFRSALSNVQVAVEDEITQGDLSAARCVITAVHTGDGLGRVPLNLPIHFTGMVMVRTRDGKIVESWNHFDFETMYKQME